MSVSLYYRARRAEPVTEGERVAVRRIVAAHEASFPYLDEECLVLWPSRVGAPADEILAGSTRMPSVPGRVLPVIVQVLGAVTALRRALPGAAWHVHLDDLDVGWDERSGYALPGMRDPRFAAELADL